jgi:hypothetical protein
MLSSIERQYRSFLSARHTSNVPVIRIPAGDRNLYLFPDRILVFGSDGLGAISYSDIRFAIEKTRFIEDGGVPRDSVVVDRTWRYVNKNGTPDRRFNSNREIPICLYEEVNLSSQSGLNEVFQLSRTGVMSGVEYAIRDLAGILQAASTAQQQRSKIKYSHVSPANFASGATSPTVQSSRLEEMSQHLLNILCCLMVVDGRASRSERESIAALMHKVKAPFETADLDQRIDLFIDQVRTQGFTQVAAHSLRGVHAFKHANKSDALAKCIQLFVTQKGQLDDRELQFCNHIKKLLALTD